MSEDFDQSRSGEEAWVSSRVWYITHGVIVLLSGGAIGGVAWVVWFASTAYDQLGDNTREISFLRSDVVMIAESKADVSLVNDSVQELLAKSKQERLHNLDLWIEDKRYELRPLLVKQDMNIASEIDFHRIEELKADIQKLLEAKNSINLID